MATKMKAAVSRIGVSTGHYAARAAFDSIRRRQRMHAMTTPQVVVALHLDQTRDGALEGVRAVALGVEQLGPDLRRTNELHAFVVERVDEENEAAGFVALVRAQPGYPVDHQRVEGLRDDQIVWCGQRFDA